ncbi:DMT family transporter [Palleronia sp. KMU-117]|uniref:DMT family transporter n=1 Tax=Palleronia sp. KMU-117 TaxID=3434108 RepID=UPI003D7662AA
MTGKSTAAAENRRGILWMVAAMVGFALEDAFIKLAAGALPLGPVVAVFGLGGFVIFAALTRARGLPLFPPEARSRPIVLRAVFEVIGRAGYFLGITLTPLSNASAILQASPLFVTLGAALFFGERVGWRRWTAIGVGFAGVLIVLRPGLEGFTPASIFTLIGTIGFAARDLGTRAAPRALSNLQLATYGFAVLIPTGLAMSPFTGPMGLPTPQAAAFLGTAILAGVAGYYSITAAMRLGEVGVVTPFRYTRLLFATGLGMAIFGERPDAMTLLGGAIIVASGLYTILRSARAATHPGGAR